MRKAFIVLLSLSLFVFLSCNMNPVSEIEKEYSIVFFNGSAIYSTISVEEGKTMGYSFPSDPSKSDYSFKGWNTASNGSGEYYTATTRINKDVHLYAVWEYEGYIISFNISGATGDTMLFKHAFHIDNPYLTMDSSVDSIRVFRNINGYLREYFISSCTADGATVSSSDPINLTNFTKKNITVNIVLGRLY